MVQIALGSDHAGYPLKQHIMEHLKAKDISLFDCGCYDTQSVHYPEYGEKVALMVTGGQARFGFLFCGTGIGISMAASKVPGIRAAVCTTPYTATMTRAHNDANILALGSRVVTCEQATAIVDAFLEAQFEGGRHKTRVDQLTKLDEKYRLKL